MNTANENILAKVRSLLKLAADAKNRGSLHEAHAAAMRADEMVQRYRLDTAAIHLPEGEQRAPDPIGKGELYSAPRTATWRSSLATVLAKHYGCCVYVERSTDGRDYMRPVSRIVLIGYESDAALVRHMFAWIDLEIGRLANLETHGRAARNAFCLGAVTGFAEALRQSKRKATTEHEHQHGPSAAMVLRERAEEVQRYVDKHVGKLYAGSGSRFRDRSAYERGIQAGARLSVNHVPGLTGRKALPAKS